MLSSDCSLLIPSTGDRFSDHQALPRNVLATDVDCKASTCCIKVVHSMLHDTLSGMHQSWQVKQQIDLQLLYKLQSCILPDCHVHGSIWPS